MYIHLRVSRLRLGVHVFDPVPAVCFTEIFLPILAEAKEDVTGGILLGMQSVCWLQGWLL